MGTVAPLPAGISTPWCAAAGWALDLFHGTRTRARFPGYSFDAVSSGRIRENASPDVPAATHRLPCSDVIHHTDDGIPCLAPELVLLFKAEHARSKDQADFAGTVPRRRVSVGLPPGPRPRRHMPVGPRPGPRPRRRR